MIIIVLFFQKSVDPLAFLFEANEHFCSFFLKSVDSLAFLLGANENVCSFFLKIS